jgi:predicted dehydrogenase
MTSLTAAVVGCGPRGREHARALQAVAGVTLVGVAEVSPPRRADAVAELGVPGFPTLPDLLARIRPAIVVLATPVDGRLAVVEALGRDSGVRALALEKPMARDLAEARRILDLCEAAGVRVVVGHQLRLCPEFVALKETIDAGDIGRPTALSGWCYGNLLDQGPHLLDMARWLAGSRPALWVMSQQCADRAALERFAAGSAPRWEDPAHPAPPWMVHHVAFEGGLRATIETGPLYQRSAHFVDDWLQKRVRVIGADGVAEAQAAGYFRLRRHGGGGRELAGTLAGYQAATRAFHEELRDAVLQGGAHRNDGRDALRSFELVVACAQSAADGSIATWPLDAGRDPLAELGAARGSARNGPVRRPQATARDPEPGAAPAPEFSVVVPLPDHRGHALDCLRSWTVGQDYPGDRYEVVVVGNGTEPEVEAAARAVLRPGDRLLRLETWNELAMYHHGAQAARGRWLLFTEPHCTAEPECLAELARYLASTPCGGACLRSVPGGDAPMARLERRLFDDGFVTWSRPGDWRKVIMRGFVLRRDVYAEVGGFEHRFDRFAEWALAATLHSRGIVLGYAAGAAVRHFDTTSFAELFPAVVSFTHGECAYRAERPGERCDRYFGAPPEWLDRQRHRRDVAWEAVRSAGRSLGRGWWRAGRPGLRFAAAMARALLGHLPAAAFGPRPRVLQARLALRLVRLRLALARHGSEAEYRVYRRLWDAMVTFARVDYLARHDRGGRAAGAPGLEVDVATLSDDRLAGFHGRETFRGRDFRWTGAVATLWLDVPPGRYEVALDTGGLLAPDRLVGVLWNGHAVPAPGLERRDGRLVFRVPAEWCAAADQVLTLTCAPLPRSSPSERRRLGVPLVAVPLGTPRGGARGGPAGAAARRRPAAAGAPW